jgi:hypothetical protein
MLGFSTYVVNRPFQGHPRREVCIHIHGTWGPGPNKEIFVTSLSSLQEVDHQIDGMIELLERVRVEAKARLEENNGQSNPLQKTGVSPRVQPLKNQGRSPMQDHRFPLYRRLRQPTMRAISFPPRFMAKWELMGENNHKQQQTNSTANQELESSQK